MLRPDEQARFQTLSGLLTADRRGDWIELDFPAKPEEPATPWDELVTGSESRHATWARAIRLFG